MENDKSNKDEVVSITSLDLEQEKNAKGVSDAFMKALDEQIKRDREAKSGKKTKHDYWCDKLNSIKEPIVKAVGEGYSVMAIKKILLSGFINPKNNKRYVLDVPYQHLRKYINNLKPSENSKSDNDTHNANEQ
jgi:hypothetical protein